MHKVRSNKRLFAAMAASFLLGMLWLLVVRFTVYEREETHYHANFALYINGEREQFNSFTFYEEVQLCVGDAVNNPKTRVHMHDHVNHVAHVHDTAATWGHLFANLGFVLGNDLVKTETGTFAEDEDSRLTFVLNGMETNSIANETIRNEDVLLINYGDLSEGRELMRERYEAITKDAADYNRRTDPSACSGGKPLSFAERLKAASKFWE